MRTFECSFTCPLYDVPREVVFKFAESTAREEGFLCEGEAFPDHSQFNVEWSQFHPVGGFRFIKVEVIVPEPEDKISEFMELIEGVNL